jgi:carboxypeptidase C (cathepsin A)
MMKDIHYNLMESKKTYSILDVADIVFVNPVNTAYSRATENQNFFWYQRRCKILSQIGGFVTRTNRPPKYLGGSYGTTRVSGLALELQNNQWMYLNGVILVSNNIRNHS